MHGFQSRSSHGYVDPDNSAARVILREIIPLQAAHPQKALARPATIPRARVAETGPKGNSYHLRGGSSPVSLLTN
jgi:hypothetical protein